MDKYKRYAPFIVRIGISLLLLWFGLNQLFDTANWLVWLPQWAYNLPFPAETLIRINGTFEVVVGSLLLLGLFTRWSALLIALHIAGIALNLGYNDIAVRDLGLAFAALSIFFNGADFKCLDRKVREKFRRSALGRLLYIFDKE